MQAKEHRAITNRQDVRPSVEQTHLAHVVDMKIGLHRKRWRANERKKYARNVVTRTIVLFSKKT